MQTRSKRGANPLARLVAHIPDKGQVLQRTEITQMS